MIRTLVRSLAFVFVAVLMIAPAAASAQGGLPSQIVPTDCAGPDAATKCSICDLAQLAQNLLNTGIFVAVVLSAFLFAYAGWQMLTSGGNGEAYAKGKRVFQNVFIGLLIVLGGWIVVDTLMKTFTSESSFGPWNSVCRNR